MTNTDENGKGQVFEQRAREVFDASVEALDARTRSRLNRARQAATAELDRRSRLAPWRAWAPAGALAAAALVAVLLWRAPGPTTQDGNGPQARAMPAQAAPAAADVIGGLVAADDDLEIATEDLDFYEWLGEQPAATGNGNG